MDLFSLGNLYPSDFLADDEVPRSDPAELKLVMDDGGLVHLAEQPDPELLWGRYWYLSGVSDTMRRALADVVLYCLRVMPVDRGDVWVDIACNDGTLLGLVPNGVTRIGVDPAESSITDQAKPHANWMYQVPFTGRLGRWISNRHGKAKVITCIAMFYDLLDPTDFLAGVRALLDPDGIFVIQVSYTPLMLDQLAFDNICHEHARYYTLTTLRRTLAHAGFDVVDAELNDVNGGSIRVTARLTDADPGTFGTAPYRDVANMRRRSLLAYEHDTLVNDPDIWMTFHRDVMKLGEQVTGFVRDQRRLGKSVWAYGASTKGNTLLQVFGLDSTLIDAIAERSPAKFGRRTVGTDIPIVSEDTMRAAKPDYMLVLPWHFIGEFVKREADYLADGGHFIVPCPHFEVI